MEAISNVLLNQLEEQLDAIHLNTSEPIRYSEEALLVIIIVFERLKKACVKHRFKSKKEEIYFFKELKPLFTSKLIYYNEVYAIETYRPFGSDKSARKYYNVELDKMKRFYKENREFYNYVRRESTFLDHNYFMRGQRNLKMATDLYYLQTDESFSTSHDFKMARILANEKLQLYLQDKINKLSKKITPNNNATTQHNAMKWTGSKVGIIELIYALHAEGVFNNGTADLKNVIYYFEKTFDVNLGQFHRTFNEITARKTDRVKFLNILQEKLLLRIERRDEA